MQAINQSTVPEKPREICIQSKNLCLAVICWGILVTSALLIHLLRPWEAPLFPGTASEFGGLFGLLLWVMGPYFTLMVMARKSHPVGAVNLLRLLGAAIVCLGGVGLYLDAWRQTPEPLMALVFFAVPYYQWAVVVALMVLDYFFKRRSRRESPEG